MKSLLIGLILVTHIAIAQPLVSYKNFKVDNDKAIWQRVFTGDVAPIIEQLKLNKAVSLVEDSNNRLLLNVDKYVFAKDGYTLAGRVVLEWKDDQYRIIMKDISYKPGNTANAMSSALLGGSVDYEFFCDQEFIKKGGLKKGMFNMMDKMDDSLTDLFSVKVSSSTSTW